MSQQNVVIEVGENPPIVTVTALALVDAFRNADRDQSSPEFMTFAVMVGHYVAPARFTLPQSFVEAGLVSPAGDLARFFKGNNALTENTHEALTLLANGDNSDQSALAAFLAVAKEQFG